MAALAIVVIVGTAAAGPAGSVKTFTGCLVVGDGVIVKIKEGDSPKSACSSGQTLARLSGGDITKISVTGGLTLTNGGESGDVEINLDPKYSLPQACADGDIAEWDTSPDPDRWVCGVDRDTTYTNGTGLALDTSVTPQRFSIVSSYRVKNTPDCDSGKFATGFDSDGNIQCGVPPSAQGIKAYAGSSGAKEVAGTTTIISKTLGAGSYVITAHVDVYTPRFDGDDSSGYCDISGDRGGFTIPAGEAYNGNVTLTGTFVQPSSGPTLLTCTETSGNIDVQNASLTAIEVDSIG